MPDRPGYGYSSFAPRRRLADWPADVLAITDHLSIARFAVLGVSGGGPHALACAASTSGRVTAASVVSSPSPFSARVDDVHRQRAWLAWLLVVPGLVRLVATALVAVVRRFPQAALGVARKLMPEADRRVVDDFGFREWFIDSSRRTSTTTARAMAQDMALFTREWRIDLGQHRHPRHDLARHRRPLGRTPQRRRAWHSHPPRNAATVPRRGPPAVRRPRR